MQSDRDDDRPLSAFVPEALGAEAPPDLADAVAGSDAAARTAAAARLREAGANHVRRLLLAAAVVLGAAVVIGVAWFGREGPTQAQEPAPQQDKEQYVVPKDAAEFRAMLGDVERITVRALYMQTRFYRPRGPVDLSSVPEAAIELPAEVRDKVLVLMDRAARAGPGPRDARGQPDTRVVLALKDGRRVACRLLTEKERWSVLAEGDFGGGEELYRALVRQWVDSHSVATQKLGVVTAALSLKPPRAARWDPQLPGVTLLDGFGDEDLELLTHFKALRRLDLSGSRVTQEGFTDWSGDLVRALRGLEELVIGVRPLDDAALRFLARNLPNLRRLDLAVEARPDGRVVKRSGPMQEDAITGVGFDAFRDHGRLESLDLSGLRHLTDAGLRAIARIGSLRRLDMMWTGSPALTMPGHAVLREAVQLRHLGLGWRTRSTFPPLHRTGDLLKFVDALPRLESLSLVGSNVTAGGLAHIRSLPSLRQLDLAYCLDLDDTGLQTITARFPDLEEVDLRGCIQVTAKGVMALTGLRGLQRLHVSASKLEDADRADLRSRLGAALREH